MVYFQWNSLFTILIQKQECCIGRIFHKIHLALKVSITIKSKQTNNPLKMFQNRQNFVKQICLFPKGLHTSAVMAMACNTYKKIPNSLNHIIYISTSYLHFHFLKISNEISQTLAFHQILKFKNVFQILSNQQHSFYETVQQKVSIYKELKKNKIKLPKANTGTLCLLSCQLDQHCNNENQFFCVITPACRKIKSKSNYTFKQHVFTRQEL